MYKTQIKRLINLRSVHVNPNIGFNPNIATTTNAVSNNNTSFSTLEQSHFAKLAPTWWDPSGNQRILHLMNSKRIEFIRATLTKKFSESANKNKTEDTIYVPKFNKDLLPNSVRLQVDTMQQTYLDELLTENVKNWKVLDMGCGGGLLTESLSRLSMFEHVKGYDITEECIQVAKAHAENDMQLKENLADGTLSYEIKDLFNDPDQTTKFNMICCFEMLEHVDEPFKVLDCLKDKLETDGVLVLSTINKELVSYLTTILAAEHVLGLVPKGTHDFNKYINCEDIENWGFKNKMELIDAKGVMFNPIKDEWELHDKKDVGNYFISFRKL
ncbi:hypothetical protein ACO0SA_000833 [Hanseniaspora valbyensis]